MHTFAKRPKETRQAASASAESAFSEPVYTGQGLEGSSIVHLQKVIGNLAVRQLPAATTSGTRTDSAAAEGAGEARSAGAGRNHAEIETARHGIDGSAGPLPYLARIQPAFGRHNVSHAHAHQGSRAAEAARAIGARAYTVGDHVAFADSPDLHTAAHEAAHVVQQRAGIYLAGGIGQVGDIYERHADAVADLVVSSRSAESLLDQMAPAGSRALGIQRQIVQRAPIKTDFGEFDTTKYDKVGPAGSEHGVDIVLTFDPDRTKVNAKKIGLTQSVRSTLAGTDVGLFPVERDRMVSSGTGAGSQIDRYGGGNYGNPLYPTRAPGAKDKLGDTPTVAGWGQHGWNYKDGATNKHQKAILKDRPTLPGRGNNSGQHFETAALAVEGAQSGTYMGSVSWGWSVDGSGKYTKDPLALKSKGVPSAEFNAAARQWNKTSVGGTVKTTASPTNVYDASYSVAFTVAKDTEVQVTSAAPIHNNVTYDEVTIKSGTKAGSAGRIKVNDMKETGGTSVIKLPIVDVKVIDQNGVRLYTNPIDPLIELVPGTPLPRGTRIRVLDSSDVMVHQIEVVDGPLSRRRGYIVALGSYRDER